MVLGRMRIGEAKRLNDEQHAEFDGLVTGRRFEIGDLERVADDLGWQYDVALAVAIAVLRARQVEPNASFACEATVLLVEAGVVRTWDGVQVTGLVSADQIWHFAATLLGNTHPGDRQHLETHTTASRLTPPR